MNGMMQHIGLLGMAYWYADPVKETEGLSEEQLFWGATSEKSMCILDILHIESDFMSAFCFKPKRRKRLFPENTTFLV